MKYLIFYLAAGVVAIVFTLVQSRIDAKKYGPSIRDSLAELRLQDATTRQRFVHKVVVPMVAGILVICGWPVAIYMLIKQGFANRAREETEPKREFAIKEQDLVEELTIEQIEHREIVNDPLGAVPDKPFGHLWPTWKSFADKLNADDPVWLFAATDDSSYAPVRLEGYVAFNGNGTQSVFIAARKSLSLDDY